MSDIIRLKKSTLKDSFGTRVEEIFPEISKNACAQEILISMEYLSVTDAEIITKASEKEKHIQEANDLFVRAHKIGLFRKI